MAYSKVPFTYTSGPQVFPTNFALGVLEADHIKVYVDGVVDGLGEPIEYAFTYNAANGDVTVMDALTSGQTGTINRIVPIDSLIADFEAGADVSKRNLVRAVKQTLMAVQEAADVREADSILINETVDEINDIASTIADSVAQTTANRLAAEAAAAVAVPAAAAAAASAATINLPPLADKALQMLRVNAGATGYEHRTPAQVRSDLGGTTVGQNLFTAADALAGRTALGATATGSALFTAADAAAGRTALSITPLTSGVIIGTRMLQWGSLIVSGGGTTVTFPQAFSSTPSILVAPNNTGPVIPTFQGQSAVGFLAQLWHLSGAQLSGTVHWLAMGNV